MISIANLKCGQGLCIKTWKQQGCPHIVTNSMDWNFPTLFTHVKILSHSVFLASPEETSKLKPNLRHPRLGNKEQLTGCHKQRLLTVPPILSGILVGNPHVSVGVRKTLHSLWVCDVTDTSICSKSHSRPFLFVASFFVNATFGTWDKNKWRLQ